MTFVISPGTAHFAHKLAKYYAAHGCVVHQQGYALVVMVPGACDSLDTDTGRCRIYDDRPELCREYDGRDDLYLRDRCKLPPKEA